MTDQTSRVKPALAGPMPDRRLRDFRLPSAEGGEARVGAYRQRRNLVVVFHHGSPCPTCRGYLDELAEISSEIADEEAVALPGPDELVEWLRFVELQCPE